MPLIKHGKVVDDPWLRLSDDDALPASGAVIVSLERWHAEHGALCGRGEPVGVRLVSHQPARELAEDLPRLSLVALEFPSFRDGRAYSTARLLRERYGYKGELRAVGNVLRDQFLFMVRCGFDAVEVATEQEAAAWEKAMNEFSVWYQAAADDRPSAARLRRLAKAAE
jgi:uncharacterized protein (DUF934 family)